MSEDRFDKLGFGVTSQLIEAGSRPILTSVETVSELLRGLSASCLERRSQYLDGKVDGSQAALKDSEEAHALGALLNGIGPRAADYFIQPWNSPEQMGRYLVEAYSLECADDEAAYCVIMSFIGEIYATLDHLIELDAVEEQREQFTSIIETYTIALLGLPYEEE